MHIIERIKGLILKLAERLGYRIIKIPISDNPSYEFIVTDDLSYAPWREDSAFVETFRFVQSHTLVDKYRCYELWDLVRNVKDVPGALIEIGVWRGGTGALIAKSAELEGINDTVYLCDTFTGVPKATEKDSVYQGGEHSDTSKVVVEDLLRSLELPNVALLSGIFPDETGRTVEGEVFRFCHIDVDVYKSAKDIVEWIWGRISVGGVIVFDDYKFVTTSGVTMYVNEMKFTRACVMVYNLNGHAVIIKTGA
jgi:O-methyltransferase